MKESVNKGDIPVGFGMALSQNVDAMRVFSEMSVDEQQLVLNKVQDVGSKSEMRSVVDSLTNGEFSL